MRAAPEFAVTDEPNDSGRWRTVLELSAPFNPSLKTIEPASITVIIATTASADRQASLLRAIHSAGEHSGVFTRIVVVVNGQQFDSALLDLLRSRKDIQVLRLHEADVRGARCAGRQLVETEFFCFLDDDDEILSNGLAVRLQALSKRPEAAFVATNGYFRNNGTDEVVITNSDMVAAEPLLAMTHECWLASCGGLYRTNLVDVESFASLPRFLEWTYLGLKLASTQRMLFLDQPTFRVHDSHDSLSKSVDYRIGSVTALKAALQLPVPAQVAHRLRVRLSEAHHSIAEDYLNDNDLRMAWANHLVSLTHPGGVKYLMFSRRLIPFWPQSSQRAPHAEPLVKRSIRRALVALANSRDYTFFPNWEFDERVIVRHLKPLFETYQIQCVLDVGANVGQFGDVVRHKLRFRGMIHSFEPVNQFVQQLKQKTSRDDAWKIHQIALGSRQEQIDINVTQSPGLSSFLSPTSEAVKDFWERSAILERQPVAVDTLDNFVRRLDGGTLPGPTFLKIDTQGFDLEVLRGAEKTLESVRAVQFEASVRPIYEGMPDFREVLDFLMNRGFVLSAMFPVNHDQSRRLIEFDCVLVNERFAKDARIL